MKKILPFFFALVLFQTINAQGVITAVPCDMLGMVMNVGSNPNAISIYHSGQYMTHPQLENTFYWEFTDQQGNVLHQDTLVNASTISFGHNWSFSDTIDVTVHFVNDSANLDNWFISEGLEPNGNSINCLFEDQIFWHIDTFSTGTPYGTWTFINNNPGVDLNTSTAINNFILEKKRLIKLVDLMGRETIEVKNKPLFYIYSDGTVKKKIIFE